MPTQFQLPIQFDLSAIFLLALTGAWVAIRRHHDFVGVFVLALVTGVGGALIRDGVFLQEVPAVLRDERYLYAVSDGRVGWHVITPLETAAGEMVLIDRGFVPAELRDPSSRAAGQIESVTTVTGIARGPDTQRLFTPDNEPGSNRWFWRDLHSMARSMFQQRLIEVAPFFIEADATPVPGGWPEGGQTRLDIPNNHLQYAITWFLLAAALLVIYGLYLRSLRRR